MPRTKAYLKSSHIEVVSALVQWNPSFSSLILEGCPAIDSPSTADRVFEMGITKRRGSARSREDRVILLHVDLMVTSPPEARTLGTITMTHNLGLASIVCCPSSRIFEGAWFEPSFVMSLP